MAKRRSEHRKGGCESDHEDIDDSEPVAENRAAATSEKGKKKEVAPPGQKRKYPACGRLSRSERNLAITHTPTSKGGSMYDGTSILMEDAIVVYLAERTSISEAWWATLGCDGRIIPPWRTQIEQE